MKTEGAKKQSKVVYAAIAVFSLIFALTHALNMFESLENKWGDFRLNLPGYLSLVFTDNLNYSFLFGKYVNKPSYDKVIIATIDDYTIGKYGFPFKRKYYGEIIEKMNLLDVKAIGVDVMFFEPDNKESDNLMFSAVGRAGNVVNLLAIDSVTKKLKLPLKGVMENSRLLAYPNSDISMDLDGHIRKFWLFYPGTDSDTLDENVKNVTYSQINSRLKCGKECADVRIVSLGMGAYSIYSGKTLAELQKRYGKSPIFVNYREPVCLKSHPGWSTDEKDFYCASYRHISIADIIEGRLSKEEKAVLKDSIVLIGSTALGTYDHFPAPFQKLFPGVEVHATTIDNLMRSDMMAPVYGGYALLLILALPWLPVSLRKFSIKTIVAVSLCSLGLLFIIDYLLLIKLWVFPLMTVALSLFLPFVYITVDKALAEGREKKWIKNTFGQYLSPKIVEVITKDPSKLSLGGEKRDMTAFFLDIAGFTTMSEKMTPEQLTKMLGSYLSGLTDVILKYDGVVDKYIGDCIMAFWNAPLDQKDHRKLACLAAVDCMGEIARLNTELTEFTIKPSARIGLNSGPMVVGNMGSKTRLSYTVMGDSVNLASRLEGANKYFHSKIMVSEYTYEEAKDFLEARRLGQIRVVGKAIPVKVYEPLAHKGKLSAELKKLLEAYNDGLEAFYKGDYDKARKAFEAALAAAPQDGPSRFYLDLAEKYSSAVPSEWDGTFNLTSKFHD